MISTPLEISGCNLWFDATQVTGLVDGDPVTTWDDKSTANNDLAPATANRPLFKTNVIFGHPALLFDGTTDGGLTAGSSGTYRSWFVVARHTAATFTNFRGLLSGTAGNAANLILAGNNGSALWFQDGSTPGYDYRMNKVDYVAANRQAPMGAWGVLSVLRNDASAWSITPQVGRDRTNTDRTWAGHVAEVVAYSALLTTSQRDAVEDYLTAKWFLEWEFDVIAAQVGGVGGAVAGLVEAV